LLSCWKICRSAGIGFAIPVDEVNRVVPRADLEATWGVPVASGYFSMSWLIPFASSKLNDANLFTHTMLMRKLLIGSLVAAAMSAALPAAARTNVEFYVNVAPPPVPYEVVPAPRVGLVWVPGYWDWRHSRYHWVAGHYVRHRPGYHYEPARFVARVCDNRPCG
jgi:hypothetical protein